MDELDHETIAAAARGDRQGFGRFYRHYAPAVWRLCLRTLNGDESLAAQVTQDVFVRAHAAMRSFNGRSAVSTWLYRIAWNRCMSVLAGRRRHWARVVQIQDAAGPDEAARIEARSSVRRILEMLDPEDRFLLTAREVEGVPFEDLAAVTGLAPGALRTRVSRIKQQIRQGGIA